MSGAVKAVRYLLANYEPLIGNAEEDVDTVVAAAEIVAGPLAQGTRAPAISIEHVSTVRRNPVRPGASDFCTSRLQITVMANTYASLAEVLGLVRDALPRSRGTVNGVSVDAILLDVEGPYFTDETLKTFLGSQDVMVTFVE
jgi:hypothetical protein